MGILRSFVIALSMYTKIPVKQFSWKDEDMRWCVAFLPVIGAAVGALDCACLYFAVKAGWQYGAVFLTAAVPVLITGGLHLDGFMDTSDALNSYDTREKKLAILKDPHIGSFAVIRLVLYILLWLAFMCAVYRGLSKAVLIEFGCIFVISRILAGLAMVYLRGARKDGLAHTFAAAADLRIVRLLLIAMSAALAVFMMRWDLKRGILLTVSNFLLFFYYRMKMYRELGGITGDTEGWLICVSELLSLCMLALGGTVWNFL